MSSRWSLSFLVLFLASPLVAADSPGKIVLVAGGDGQINGPFGVDFDSAGNLYFVEMTNNRVGKIDPKGTLTIIAGTGKKKSSAGDGGPAKNADIDGVHSLAVAPNGDIYLSDTWNCKLRKIDGKTGIISTVAGTGERGFSGDGGPAAQAKFAQIHCVALDPKGERLYLADLDNRRIRAVDVKTGIATTVAGNGQRGVPKDGALAVDAPLLDPRAVAVDAKGNIYILERAGNTLRVVDPEGRIRTVAGTGKKGATGDGGDALLATLNGPKHLCIDRDGGVLIADSENHTIRKYLPESGKIIRIAGTGKKGDAGIGGPPDKAELAQPHGIFVHPSGDLYISDSSNNRILKIVR